LESGHFEDRGGDGGLTFGCVLGKHFEDRSWMELHQDRVQWQALALAVLNLRGILSFRCDHF